MNSQPMTTYIGDGQIGGETRRTPEAEYVERLEARLEKAEKALREIRELVDEQAEDDVLWPVYPLGVQPISEAHVQQELRRLHEVIERHTFAEPEEL